MVPRPTHSPQELELIEIVTVEGDHLNRWRQVFEILDEALYRQEDNRHDEQQMRTVREMLARRAI
jgi:hypothetical protein